MNITAILIIAAILNLLECFVIFRKKKPDGRLLIDMDDPMKDVYTLEIFIPFGELNNRKDLRIIVDKEK